MGFKILLTRGWHSLVVGVAAGLAFGLYMAAADALLFRSVIPEVQSAVLATLSLGQRWANFLPGAVIDEVLYRLLGVTAVAWLLAQLTTRPGEWTKWAAILIAAFVLFPLSNIAYFVALDWSALTITREIALHGTAGTLWGWLYWRHGWLAAVSGHVSAHVALQPLLGMM